MWGAPSVVDPTMIETDHEIRVSIRVPAESRFPRFLGCLMIGMMPDRGLEEALFALRDMLDFYAEQPTSTRALPEAKTLNAMVVSTEKRPDLFITP